MNKVEEVKSVLEPAIKSNRFAKVVFTKKNGELRELLLGRSRSLEATVAETPSESTVKRNATLKENGMLCVEEAVYDAATKTWSHQFRTVNLNTVKSVTAFGRVLNWD